MALMYCERTEFVTHHLVITDSEDECTVFHVYLRGHDHLCDPEDEGYVVTVRGTTLMGNGYEFTEDALLRAATLIGLDEVMRLRCVGPWALAFHAVEQARKLDRQARPDAHPSGTWKANNDAPSKTKEAKNHDE